MTPPPMWHRSSRFDPIPRGPRLHPYSLYPLGSAAVVSPFRPCLRFPRQGPSSPGSGRYSVIVTVPIRTLVCEPKQADRLQGGYPRRAGRRPAHVLPLPLPTTEHHDESGWKGRRIKKGNKKNAPRGQGEPWRYQGFADNVARDTVDGLQDQGPRDGEEFSSTRLSLVPPPTLSTSSRTIAREKRKRKRGATRADAVIESVVPMVMTREEGKEEKVQGPGEGVGG
ncbi:hypothetical protein LZ30DRAFT_181752 [Colletotrichum cereale]|nr:hypothetical protein LZ30DRAFT_181752 [Colletotrichum cereale]